MHQRKIPKNEHWIIGSAGSGKSEYLIQLVQESIEQFDSETALLLKLNKRNIQPFDGCRKRVDSLSNLCYQALEEANGFSNSPRFKTKRANEVRSWNML